MALESVMRTTIRSMACRRASARRDDSEGDHGRSWGEERSMAGAKDAEVHGSTEVALHRSRMMYRVRAHATTMHEVVCRARRTPNRRFRGGNASNVR